MSSALCVGKVVHTRQHPVRHSFVYPVYFQVFDVAELPELHRKFPWFSHNGPNVLSFHDRDYLQPGPLGLDEKIRVLLRERPYGREIAAVRVVTCARYFNHVFNPVSIFYCYRGDDTLACAIAEVRNTYGEKHLYVLDEPLEATVAGLTRFRAKKEFFVSPFNTLQGEYEFSLSAPRGRVDIRIDLVHQGAVVVHSRLVGACEPLGSAEFARTLMKYPFAAALALPRIALQARKLKRQGLKDHLKPRPTHPLSFRG